MERLHGTGRMIAVRVYAIYAYLVAALLKGLQKWRVQRSYDSDETQSMQGKR